MPIASRTITWVLLAATMAIAALSLVLQLLDILVTSVPEALRNFTNVDMEINLPTWFISSLLLLVAVAAVHQIPRPLRVTQNRTLLLLAASALMALLSLDEYSRLHERVQEQIESRQNSVPWAKTAIVVAAVVTLPVFLWLIGRGTDWLRTEDRIRLAAAFAVLLGSGIIIDGINDGFDDYFATGTTNARLANALAVTLEETGEMIGAVLLLHAFLLLPPARSLSPAEAATAHADAPGGG